MRFTLPIVRRLASAFRNRDWFSVAFELFVVVFGVALGLEASRWAAAREDRAYRGQVLASLDRTFAHYETGCRRIHEAITSHLDEYNRRTAAGERPSPPTFVLPGIERPPTRAWEALVASGAARSIDPDLMFRIAFHFDRADSFGDKYQRYNALTDQQIAPYRDDPSQFYGSNGKLKPSVAAHMALLRDLLAFNDQMGEEATAIRRELKPGKVTKPDATTSDDLPLRF